MGVPSAVAEIASLFARTARNFRKRLTPFEAVVRKSSTKPGIRAPGVAGHIACLSRLHLLMNIHTAMALALMRGVMRNRLLAAMRDLAPVDAGDGWLETMWARLEG